MNFRNIRNMFGFGQPLARQGNRQARRQAKLNFESLGRKDLMAASVLLSGTTLNVYGTEDVDRVQLESYTITGPSTSGISLMIPMVRATVSDASNTVLAQGGYVSWSVADVYISTYGGSDNITQPLSFNTTIYSGEGSDIVTTGSGSDYIVTAGGDDIIGAGEGNNTIYGGSDNDFIVTAGGNDYISATDGNDSIFSGAGNDSIWAGAGSDRIIAGQGNDSLDGGENDDYISGDDGLDSIWGSTGNDTIYGGAGNDQLIGNEDNDLIYGSTGNDTIWGSTGNDTLYGNDNDDVIYAGDGNDSLYAGAGSDKLYGEAGNDLLVAIDSDLTDSLYGGSGTDNFWYDKTNLLADSTDASAAEINGRWTHGVVAFANGADKSLDGDNIADPTDIGTKASFASSTLFATSGPSNQDIDQGGLGDCWLMSALGEAARANANSIRRSVVSLGDGTYGVALGSNYYRVDAELPTDGSGNLRLAGSGVDDDIWVAIMEKAYAKYRDGSNTYSSLGGGWSSEVWNALGATNSASKSYGAGQGATALSYIQTERNAGKAVVVSINNAVAGSGLASTHVYMVEAVDTALGQITLRNPWGTAGLGANNNLITVTGAQLVSSLYSNGNGIQSANLIS